MSNRPNLLVAVAVAIAVVTATAVGLAVSTPAAAAPLGAPSQGSIMYEGHPLAVPDSYIVVLRTRRGRRPSGRRREVRRRHRGSPTRRRSRGSPCGPARNRPAASPPTQPWPMSSRTRSSRTRVVRAAQPALVGPGPYRSAVASAGHEVPLPEHRAAHHAPSSSTPVSASPTRSSAAARSRHRHRRRRPERQRLSRARHPRGRHGRRQIVGVAKDVSLVAVRVLNCSGSGSFAGVIAGVDWVTTRRLTNPWLACGQHEPGRAGYQRGRWTTR